MIINDSQQWSGVWPVMLTPFTAAGRIDYQGVDCLVDWYIDAGVSGLFAVCLSSEMYHLTPAERLELAAHVVAYAAGRVPVVAAGLFGSDPLPEQVRRLADTGVAAVVLTVNQLAAADEADELLQRNLERLLDASSETLFGLYECPQPLSRRGQALAGDVGPAHKPNLPGAGRRRSSR